MLLFRGHYVSHTMTERAAAHVVSASNAPAKARAHDAAGDAPVGKHAAKNKERRERQKAARERDRAEQAKKKGAASKPGGTAGKAKEEEEN